MGKRKVDVENAVEFLAGSKQLDPDKMVLFGLSMGGHVVARLVGANPDRFEAVILVNPAAYGLVAEDKKLKPSTEFTDAIRESDSWKDSGAFDDLSKFEGPTLIADSQFDDVIPAEVKEKYRASAQKLEKHMTLPGIKHAFFSANDEECVAARNTLYNEVIDFLGRNK